MSEPEPPSLERFAGYRAASALWSKLVDAVAVIILIRALSRADYGIIGLASGWLVALGFLNLNPETILWRDFRKLQPQLPRFMGCCVRFWLLKSSLLCALAGIVALIQFQNYHQPMLLIYLPAAMLFSALAILAACRT